MKNSYVNKVIMYKQLYVQKKSVIIRFAKSSVILIRYKRQLC